MKKFTIALLSVIFVTLIACSVQSISADHESGNGIFKDRSEVNLTIHSPDNTIQSSDYKIYLQAIIRNGDDQLISVTESTATGAFIDHELTDHVFDTLMGQKEIVVINNIKYEKVQYTYTPPLEFRAVVLYPIFSEIDFSLEIGAEQTAKMHSKKQQYAHWKIDYCATFGGSHGTSCVPIFQVLVPNMTVEPDDTVTQYWTILRQIS